ncbi:hypothetical protein C1H46_040841 [Malus baccata]|uniref:Autophagy-related protein n=1 Tax=Malus baccata TaxID=106549 RepID=A0A540KHE6_MALBA|nr:hypothetical protein C1H46_040841 [Malus baccata]
METTPVGSDFNNSDETKTKIDDELRAGIMESERILKRQTKRKSPIGSISMVESFDACPHEESEAHEEDDIDSGRRRTLLLQLMARYCVDSSMRFGDFVDFIRKQIKHHGSLFVYVNGREPETDFLMYQVYANNIDKYGFLCMTYSGECRICGLGNMSPILMASGILGSTSKGKSKIPISSSSSKGDGGGNGVPPGGGDGNGVTPGGGNGVPTGGGGGDVGGRERRMVDIVRRVRWTGQIEEEELLIGIIALENTLQARIGELYLGLLNVNDYELYFVNGAHTWSRSLFVDQMHVRGASAINKVEFIVVDIYETKLHQTLGDSVHQLCQAQSDSTYHALLQSHPPTSPPPSPGGTLSPPPGVTRSPPPSVTRSLPPGETSSPPPPPSGTPSPLEEEMGILLLEVELGIPLAIKI